jgi:hypothetical protein
MAIISTIRLRYEGIYTDGNLSTAVINRLLNLKYLMPVKPFSPGMPQCFRYGSSIE